MNTNEAITASSAYVSGPHLRGWSKISATQVQTPSTFRGDPATQPDSQSLANLKWFELFKDEKLQQLIHDALANNYDLREAVARIDAARANLGIVRSEQFPTSSPAVMSLTSETRAAAGLNYPSR